MNLTHIKVGDKLATPIKGRWDSVGPTHRIYTVTELTATQIKASAGSAEMRVRRSDGRVIGDAWRDVVEVTPEFLVQHEQQVAIERRTYEARRALGDLAGKHLNELRLTLEQTEALAAAWVQVKAMAEKPATTGGSA